MSTIEKLAGTLGAIDGRGYKAYKDIQGAYEFDGGTLYVDYVQGDPFAGPSRVCVRLEAKSINLPSDLIDNQVRTLALEDFLARRLSKGIAAEARKSRGTGKSGLLSVDAGAQEVLKRTAVAIRKNGVDARIEVGLPAQGRKVLGRQAREMLCDILPDVTRKALSWSSDFAGEARAFVECVENQEHIRAQLGERGLVAFIAEGSMLPRESGVSDRPLSRKKGVVFTSPEALRVSFELPHPLGRFAGGGEGSTTITGMGIPHGVTLIVGGGYHGKSTLLRAIERGVYPHIPGDGREYAVSDSDAVKIRSEDRRRIERVNISPYISDLPDGRTTRAFSTEEASGSTSQAAGFQEALESGATALLVDEDTSATNLMIRDARMQRLVEKSDEPITPFLDRVRELSTDHSVSTVLVMGGAGDYFDVADTVIMMKQYRPHEVTEQAREISAQFPSARGSDSPEPVALDMHRIASAESVDPARTGKPKVDAPATDRIRYGGEDIDLRAVEQLVDRSQTRAVAYALAHASRTVLRKQVTIHELLDTLEKELAEQGLEILSPFHRPDTRRGVHPGNLALPRRHEIAAALNRLRSLQVKTDG
ncbi:MAG: ABC-ATPase domain-containing protein [Spirochaetia bacterium]